ncbi:MAG: DUF4385 domain-containing protein [Pyrinomonadaceae bacterium]|nr:DUF4385 domain-containing protein [Pyrinomonadaceae bacterium]
MKFDYTQDFEKIDFRKNPEKYQIGIGEQGVLLVEPYKSEIVKFWRFKTPEIARESADKIYELYLQYAANKEFVGMDMARKFLEMGFTRSRRYANHPSGKKYEIVDGKRKVRKQADDALTSDKAESARIFKEIRDKVINDETYQMMREQHREIERQQSVK